MVRTKPKGEKKFSPSQFLAISFLAAIALGTGLLLLPFSTRSGHISFIDALFRSTSSVCVTGLTVQDTASSFTGFGQAVNLFLFQLGGLGIMTFSTLILLVAGKKISFTDRVIIQHGFHPSSPKNVKTLIQSIFLYTLGLEAAGALVLFLHWRKEFPFGRDVFLSVYHSISAFCNAGFSLFSTSFESFRNDTWINLTLVFLIVLGGIGFLVLQESKNAIRAFLKRKKPRLSLHAKIVLSFTFFLIAIPFVLFLAVEWNSTLQNFSVKEKILSTLFQVVTARTAGFNTMNLGILSFPSVMLLILLMFIGASPGSTGGGIKTSTFGVIFAFLKSKITARESVNLFYRTLPLEMIMRAFTVVTLSFSILFLSTFIISLAQPHFQMKSVIFEVFSAFGTVGLSLGITPKLNTLSKIVIILTMYIGRIGPLTLLWAFSRKKSLGRYEYLEETVMIG
jgi:trk system potassium uptake protein TrkH